ncbi:hypothetical protein K5I29_02060 [Flavobacterium agricola]|uniref:Trimeric autotransporter adhesin YadA-like head domain-containing protein n=1 Tax=Flavobacterium agricola TaxID=2870839 RepID=A0ABY6LZI9_9FLAO|nr:hypothetical protein [Flavobacterium agricola]UYW01732.1 hypothetical protein K5I29_02060 [Flavobacterium agricola]
MYLKVLVFVLICNVAMVRAQVGIGTTTPHASAILDISSTNSGILIPRIKLLTDGDDSGINKPATGLLVFNTNVAKNLQEGFYYWNGKNWKSLQGNNSSSPGTPDANVWGLFGNSNTNRNQHFIGTTDWQDLSFRVTNEAFAKFGVHGTINLGFESQTEGMHSVAIGYAAKTNTNHAFAIGSEAQAKTQYSYALGHKAITSANESYAIGKEAQASGYISYAIGYLAKARSNDTFAIGNQANASGYQSYAIGKGSNASNNNAYTLGNESSASGQQAIAVGNKNQVTANNALVFGNNSSTTGSSGMAIGNETNSIGYQAYAIGNKAYAKGDNSLAIGQEAKAQALNSLAIGNNAQANNHQSTAIGFNATTDQDNAIVIGNNKESTKIGIGTSKPDEKLHVAGTIKIVDGSQGAGKVLTSDANGKASWQNLEKTIGDFTLSSDEFAVNDASLYKINFTNKVNLGIEPFENGFRVKTPGNYLVTYTITLEGTKGNNGRLEFFLGKYTNKVDDCSVKTSISKDEIKTVTLSRIINITNIYDVYSLYVRLDNASSNGKILKAGTNLLVQKI